MSAFGCIYTLFLITTSHDIIACTQMTIETYCDGNYVPSYQIDDNGKIIITNVDHSNSGKEQTNVITPILVTGGAIILILAIIKKNK